MALIVALAAAKYAKRSASSTEEAVALAEEQVRIMREEHSVFMDRLNARADLRVALRVVNADEDGVLRIGGNGGLVRVEIGLSNAGERAAGRTTVNALLPHHRRFEWCHENGQRINDQTRTPARLNGGETLTHPDRGEIEAWYRATTLDGVGRTEHPCRYISFDVELSQAHQETAVPLRVRVSSDDLPDGVGDVVADLLVRVQRKP